MANSEFKFTVDLLREYSAAALQNSAELLEEASLLCGNGHAARAYFLAVASIEESGKALQAFDAQGRNLADSAVTARLKQVMADHSQKITAAFTAMLYASPNIRESLIAALDLIGHLKRGREPSMYTDIQYEESKLKIPSEQVREVAARDCVRLASKCLSHARRHIEEKDPQARSRSEDQLFAMKSDHFQKMANTEDFWWYYVAQLESGKQDFAAAAVAYQREFISMGKTFKQPDMKKGGS